MPLVVKKRRTSNELADNLAVSCKSYSGNEIGGWACPRGESRNIHTVRRRTKRFNKRDITCLINGTCVAPWKLYYRFASTLERKLLRGYDLPLSGGKTSGQLTSGLSHTSRPRSPSRHRPAAERHKWLIFQFVYGKNKNSHRPSVTASKTDRRDGLYNVITDNDDDFP